MGSMARWIATTTVLGLLLIASSVQAAEPTVIYLSCDGTRRQDTEEPDLVDKMGLIVNLGEHTVSTSDVLAHIDMALPDRVEFSSEDIGRVLVVTTTGFIDHVTGKTRITYTTKFDNEYVGTTVYDLVCKVSNRLF
jgi:hypothetical protein